MGSGGRMESFLHPDQDNAPSDGPNMLKLEDFDRVVGEIHEYSYTNTR